VDLLVSVSKFSSLTHKTWEQSINWQIF